MCSWTLTTISCKPHPVESRYTNIQPNLSSMGTLCREKITGKVNPYPKEQMKLRELGKRQIPDLPGPRLDLNDPPTAPFEDEESNCDKDCYVCFPQYFSAQCSISPEDAQKATSILATSIQDDYNYLRRLLETNADDLACRWNKMSQAKREDILDNSGELYNKQPALVHLTNANMKLGDDRVFPRMARSMVQLGYNAGCTEGAMEFLARHVWTQMLVPVLLEATKAEFLDTWFHPYLDTESFSRSPLPFLSLLNSRTQHPPFEWALFDKMNIVAAEQMNIMPGQYNPKCISFHPDDYGCLRDWDQKLAHQQTILGYSQGIFVLTSQSRILKFLRKVVNELLCDIQRRGWPAEVTNHIEPGIPTQSSGQKQEKWLQLVTNGFSTFGLHPVVSWSSYTHQHLVAPPQADPMELSTKIRTVYQDTLDGLWALQTDPGAVQLAVKELCSCLYFHYLDKTKEWGRIADEVIFSPIRREMLWRQTLKECEKMIAAYKSFQENRSEKNRLRFDSSLLILHDCCTEQLIWAIRDLQYSLPYQPGFEKNYEWKRGSNGKRKAPQINAKDWFLHDPLFWSLDCLCNDPYRDLNCDPVVYLRAFDEQLHKASEKERRRVSSSLLTLVGDVAAIDEVRTVIQCTRGIDRIALKEFLTDPRFKIEQRERHELAQTFIKTRYEVLDIHDLCSAAAPALKELCTRHPWPKGITTLESAQRASDARDVLAQMWEKIRCVFNKAVIKNGMGGPVMKEYVEIWSLDLSQEYQSLRRSEQEEAEAALKAKIEAKDRLRAATSALLQRPKTTTAIDTAALLNQRQAVLQEISTNKPKLKTQGRSGNEALFSAPADLATSTSTEVDVERIKVKLANLPLLHQMFPLGGSFSDFSSPETSRTGTRTWKWQHFVDVMMDAGFSVSQGSGSAVSFEHSSGKGRIVFHQPHPQPIIDPVMLRFMGRRLNRWFGWHRETFVERV